MKTVITRNSFADHVHEKAAMDSIGATLSVGPWDTVDEIVQHAKDADGIFVQFSPFTKALIDQLENCKAIIRYGIGYDNVDLEAATAKGIQVCNIPDYCIEEVADHAVSLALALGRQLPALDKRLRKGNWSLSPVTPMHAFREMNFVTYGLGRIACGIHRRAKAFGFKLHAYDPFVDDALFTETGVSRLHSVEEMFSIADVLSINAPMTGENKHLVNKDTLAAMKPTSILINTARGPLINTVDLAEALNNRIIAYAGIDVFEEEPIPLDHPLLSCENALLTSHMSYYSESSITNLQKCAAEEMVRCLRGGAPKNPVNQIGK
ncbi:MAG: C-terminal binding protein [Puniceicoccaceae bacterium]